MSIGDAHPFRHAAGACAQPICLVSPAFQTCSNVDGRPPTRRGSEARRPDRSEITTRRMALLPSQLLHANLAEDETACPICFGTMLQPRALPGCAARRRGMVKVPPWQRPSSAPVPQLSSCASSGRACRFWACLLCAVHRPVVPAVRLAAHVPHRPPRGDRLPLKLPLKPHASLRSSQLPAQRRRPCTQLLSFLTASPNPNPNPDVAAGRREANPDPDPGPDPNPNPAHSCRPTRSRPSTPWPTASCEAGSCAARTSR
eukprot:scaffold12305_cov59-Phaeocystis_antarctica.AAC.1